MRVDEPDGRHAAARSGAGAEFSRAAESVFDAREGTAGAVRLRAGGAGPARAADVQPRRPVRLSSAAPKPACGTMATRVETGRCQLASSRRPDGGRNRRRRPVSAGGLGGIGREVGPRVHGFSSFDLVRHPVC